jgi:hypothetical protein
LINTQFNINISTKPLRTYLKENNYSKVIKARKINISNINIQKRIYFIEEYIHKDLEFFRRIIWSDEFTVKAAPNTGFIKLWNRPNNNIIKSNKLNRFLKREIFRNILGLFLFLWEMTFGSHK